MNDNLKAREFCKRVRELADEYNLPFFVVTDGASATKNNNCEAVRVARENHIAWEKSMGYNPEDDWFVGYISYINFPETEYDAYQKRINNKQIIYTTRVSNEVGKYELNKVYNSHFGNLKVVYYKHFTEIKLHPFYDELTGQQISEIEEYIQENGYDLIGLVKI